MIKEKLIINTDNIPLTIKSNKNLIVKGQTKLSKKKIFFDVEYKYTPKNILISTTIKSNMISPKNNEIKFYFRFVDDKNHCYFSIKDGQYIKFAVVGKGKHTLETSWIKITEGNLFKDKFSFILSVFEETTTVIISDTMALNIEETPEVEGKAGIRFVSSNDEGFNIEMENLHFTEEILNFESIIKMPKTPEVFFMIANNFYDQKRYDLALVYYKKGLLFGPGDDKIYNRIGNLLFLIEEYWDAIKFYQRSIELDPENEEYKINLGRAYIKTNKEKEALDILEEPIKKGLKDPNLLIDYSLIWINNGEYEKALYFLKKAEKKAKNNSTLLYRKGKCLINLGDIDAGKKSLYEAANILVRTEPSSGAIILKYSLEKKTDIDSLKLLCELLKDNNDYRDIYELIKKSRCEIDIDDQLIEELINAEIKLDLYDKALEEYKNLKTKELTPNLRHLKMLIYINLSKYKEANKEINYFIKNNNDLKININELVYYKLMIMNLSEKITDCKKEITLLKKNKSYYFQALGEYGKILIAEKQYKKGINTLAEVINSKEIIDPKIYYFLGIGYYNLEDLVSAKNNLLKVYNIIPNDPVIPYVLSNIFFYMREYDSALKILTDSYSYLPNDGRKDNLLGNIYMAKGLLNNAHDHFENALGRDPKNIEFSLNLAELYYRCKNYNNAYQITKKILDKDRSKQAETLNIKLRSHLLISIKCSRCNREWDFLKGIHDTEITKKNISKLPPQAPAGACAKCGKIYCKACVNELNKKKNICPLCQTKLELNSSGLRIIADKILRGRND